jgi:hypothetical protein
VKVRGWEQQHVRKLGGLRGQYGFGWCDGWRCGGSEEWRCGGWKHNVVRCNELRSKGGGDARGMGGVMGGDRMGQDHMMEKGKVIGW